MEEGYSPEIMTYQYPNPDHAAYATSEAMTQQYFDLDNVAFGSIYPWAGENDDHVPAALRTPEMGSWDDREAGFENIANAPVGEPSSHRYDDFPGLRNDATLDTDYLAPESDDRYVFLVPMGSVSTHSEVVKVRRWWSPRMRPRIIKHRLGGASEVTIAITTEVKKLFSGALVEGDEEVAGVGW